MMLETAIILALPAAYFLPQLRRPAEVAALARRCARRRALVLTYDDGPSDSLTAELLDLLKAHKACASFFPLGRRIAGHEALLDRAVAEGHLVGAHGRHHAHAWRSAPWHVYADAAAGLRSIEKWRGTRPWFRPPYGKYTLPTLLATRGCRRAWWTQDSGDTHAILPDPANIVHAVVAAGGGVVLLHDHDENRLPERLQYVLQISEKLLKAARENGWSCPRLDEL